MRIRAIKPEFFLHEALFDLEAQSKLPVRLAYVGLWCAADREGRFSWEPRKLKAQILPYDELDFSSPLDALAGIGLIVRYSVGDSVYGFIPTFHKHQHINVREAASIIPECDSTCAHVHARACTSPARVPSLPVPISLPSSKERESEGKPDHYHKDSRAALHILNEAAGVHFREVDSNLTIISARLREPDVTIDGVREMILRQCKRWKGTPQAEYLRPETLFGKTKFDSYYAARQLPINSDNGHAGSKNPNRNTGIANDPSKYSSANLRKLPNFHGAEQVPSPVQGPSSHV